MTDKEIPHTFLGGLVVTAVRVSAKAGQAPHQALVIVRHAERGEKVHSVHWMLSQKDDGPWYDDQGDYDMSFPEAFVELERRLTLVGALPPF